MTAICLLLVCHLNQLSSFNVILNTNTKLNEGAVSFFYMDETFIKLTYSMYYSLRTKCTPTNHQS